MVYFVSTDKSRSRRPRRRNAEINITNLMDVMMEIGRASCRERV